ncbi:MAG: ATP-binding cassette domain-containing protein, partial [Caldilinea sp.]
MNAIESYQLVKSYPGRGGPVQALRGVTFSVQRGEIYALLGPNGAGKTTLFSVIAGQFVADAGAVRFAGCDLARVPVARRAALGIARTFQTAQAF